MFDDPFVEALPDEVFPAALKLKAKFDGTDETISQQERPIEAFYSAYVKAYGVLQAFCLANKIDIEFPLLTTDKMESITIVRQAFLDLGHEIANYEKVEAQRLLEKSKFHFDVKFGNVFLYKFSEGDLKSVHSLTGELIKLISSGTQFDDHHQSRIIKRLKKIQGGLQKEVPDLDQLYALIGEAGVMLSKLGRNSKPLIDRIIKIIEIVWRTQARAEELPSDMAFPLISKK